MSQTVGRASASVSAVIGSLAMWPRLCFLCPNIGERKRKTLDPMRSDPICWIKIKHLDMRLMGILVSHPSPALVLSLTASVNAGYVSCAEDLSV